MDKILRKLKVTMVKTKYFFDEHVFRYLDNKLIYFTVMGILIAVFIYSAISIYLIYDDYGKGKKTYDDLANFVVIEDTPNPDDPDDNKKTEKGDNKKSDEKVPLSIDFKSLKKFNSDVIGWIYCPDTVINYPVVQGSDNEFYLKHIVDKTSSKNGTPFIDCQNSKKIDDDNTLIYAHHMKNGSMFASLVKYESQDYFEKHPYVYLLTPEQNYKIELFSGYVTEGDSNAFVLNFANSDSFDVYLKKVIKKSTFNSKIKVSSKDKLVTLSTCTYDFKNARYVVHGKLTKTKTVYK